MALGEADRVAEVRDITWADADPELEAQVDDLGTVVDGVADSAGDCCGVAGATGPKNPQRHDRRAVGEAGQREAVVGCLCDLAGDERAMTFAIDREPVVGHEVIGVYEARALEVGRRDVVAPAPVGDSGVEQCHHHPAPPGAAIASQVRPGSRCIYARSREEVPLHLLPAPALMGQAGVIGNPRAGDGGEDVACECVAVGGLHGRAG